MLIHCIVLTTASHSVFSFIFMSKVDIWIWICIPSVQLGNKQSCENSNKMFQWNTCHVRKSIEWIYRFLFLYKKYRAKVFDSISNWMDKWMNDSFSFCFCFNLFTNVEFSSTEDEKVIISDGFYPAHHLSEMETTESNSITSFIQFPCHFIVNIPYLSEWYHFNVLKFCVPVKIELNFANAFECEHNKR